MSSQRIFLRSGSDKGANLFGDAKLLVYSLLQDVTDTLEGAAIARNSGTSSTSWTLRHGKPRPPTSSEPAPGLHLPRRTESRRAPANKTPALPEKFADSCGLESLATNFFSAGEPRYVSRASPNSCVILSGSFFSAIVFTMPLAWRRSANGSFDPVGCNPSENIPAMLSALSAIDTTAPSTVREPNLPWTRVCTGHKPPWQLPDDSHPAYPHRVPAHSRKGHRQCPAIR